MSTYPFELTANDGAPNRWGGSVGGTLPPTMSPAADQQNGASGGMTPASTANATSQSQQSRTSDNVFTDVLNHVNAFNGALGGIVPKPPSLSGEDGGQALNGQVGGFQQAPPGYNLYNQVGVTHSLPTDPSARQSAIADTRQGTLAGNGGGVGGVPPSPSSQSQPSSGGGLKVGSPTQPESGDPRFYDPRGQPWSAANPPPKPPNTEDPAIWADWASKFSYLDPSLANITAADAVAYRTSGYQATPEVLAKTPEGNNFIAWWQNGKPTPAQTQQPPPNVWTPSLGARGPQGPPMDPKDPSYARWLASGGVSPTSGASSPPMNRDGTPFVTPPPPSTAPPPATAPPAGGSSPPPATPPPPSTAPPPAPAPSSIDEITKLIDLFNSGKGPQQPPIEDMLNPMFARQRQLVADQLQAGYSAKGVHSGGANYNIDQAVSNLAGQQSAALASEMGQDYLAKLNQNTQLTQLATQAGMQKYLSDINTDLEKYKVNTNSDLQKWLTDKNNVLAKYGIDTNDVLQRYLGKLGIDKANIDANATIQAAALHAAAAEAGAAASSAAAALNANVNLQLGTGNLQVQREHNMADFILGLLGLGQGDLSMLGNVFNNFPTGSIVVKP